MASPNEQLKVDEIKKIINEKLGGISTDSGFEITELVEAFANSGKKKNRETVEEAIEHVKGDIEKYMKAEDPPLNIKKQSQNNELRATVAKQLVATSIGNGVQSAMKKGSLQTVEDIKNKIKSYIDNSNAGKKHGSFCCGTGGSIKKKRKRKTAKRIKGKKEKRVRKWSKKYKNSINCKKPKGFSQRQHCLAKSKKVRRRRKIEIITKTDR